MRFWSMSTGSRGGSRALVARITELGRRWPREFMEGLAGGHTHTIYRHGIEHLLPTSVELVHGPRLPGVRHPMGRIDDAIAVAQAPGSSSPPSAT